MFRHRSFSALGLAALAVATAVSLPAPSVAATASASEASQDIVRVGSRCEVYVNGVRKTPYLCYGP